MLPPHYHLMLWCVALCLCGLSLPAQAQQPDDKTRGIQLYQQNDAANAVPALKAATKRNKNDVEAWHYLGLALNQQGQVDEARKAHEKAVQIAEKAFRKQLEASDDSNFSERVANLKSQLLLAAESADHYLKLSNKLAAGKIVDWQGRAMFLRVMGGQKSGSNIYSAKEVTQRAIITSRPEPDYTYQARSNGVTGTVTLRLLLGENGKVYIAQVLKGLSHGLIEEAIKAAQRIKFTPATKDGRPVSQFVQIEYSFNVY